MKQLQHFLDENALVVFDVDETLIMAVDRAQRRHPEAIISALRKIYFSDQVPDIARWELLESIIWKMLGQKLIDAESPTLIKGLQTRKIQVIALTHMHAGTYCAIASMQEWLLSIEENNKEEKFMSYIYSQ